MNRTPSFAPPKRLGPVSGSAQDWFGERVARRLEAGSTHLPHEVAERLRVARLQAVAARKRPLMQQAPVLAGAGGGLLGLGDAGDDSLGWGHRIASALPLVVLVVGLLAIHTFHNERRASEVAEVDAALLTDDLPPAAYTDPGFVQYLKLGQ